jgi:probable HAF family extracellular repeat protein
MITAMSGPIVARASDDQISTYTVTDLGGLTPPGSDGYCSATGLNDSGTVVGGTGTAYAADTRAFLWQDGTMTDISLGGFETSSASAINDEGEVAGNSNTFSPTTYTHQGWIWRSGEYRTVGSDFTPIAINQHGLLAGLGVDSSGTRRAEVWKRGLATFLPPDGVQSDATAINAAGTTVGEFYTPTDSGIPPTRTIAVHAALWRDAHLTDLGQFGPALPDTIAFTTAIDSRGWVVGQSTAPGMLARAFLWRDGVMTDLGALPNFANSRANGINDAGLIVGSSSLYIGWAGLTVTRATLWDRGKAIDLNSLKPPGFKGTLIEATAVNRSGQIAGEFSIDPYPTNSYNYRCFLMSPTHSED